MGIAKFIDPPTEYLNNGETVLWRITHLGVDSHVMHFHLFDLQVINRVDYANTVKQPYPDELGWREAIRTNPFEDIFIALKPTQPVLPFPEPHEHPAAGPLDACGFHHKLPAYSAADRRPGSGPNHQHADRLRV